jgi:hypothetical protein
VASAGLSPSLSRETEIVHDLGRFPENDLYRQFLSERAKDLPKWHHYFEIYDQWFSGFRGRADLRLLEIGVAHGESLKLWRQYFGAGATIVGLDIEAGCKAFENREQNTFVEIGDQTDVSFLKHVAETYGPFDIIIDDGGHTTAQQTISFNQLYTDALKDPGIYLVEDLHSNFWPEFQDSEQTFVDYAKQLADHLYECYVENPSIHAFEEGNPNQQRSMTVSTFCATTRSIAFYDSIIVFEKRRRSMPILERRG